ncbi:MAG: type II toxin-antitoxin system VapC family toxin, partial [Natronosporangium sp.]
YEVANVLRRQVLAGKLDHGSASLAHRDLVALPIDYYPYQTVADRIWQLRNNLSAYDAAHVSVAELLAASLITLDARLAGATGPACPILAYRPVS